MAGNVLIRYALFVTRLGSFLLKNILIHWPFYLFCIFLILYIYSSYLDYPSSHYESEYYNNGKILKEYFLRNNNQNIIKLKNSSENYLYPALLSIINPANLPAKNHFINFLLYLSTLIITYAVFYSKYKSKYISLIPPLMIFMTPILTGTAPIDPRSIFFIFSYIWYLYILYIFSTIQNSKHNLLKIFIIGILLGILLAQNILGVSAFALYLLFIFYNLLIHKHGSIFDKIKILAKYMGEFILIIPISLFIVFVTSPFFADNIIQNVKTTYLPSNNVSCVDTIYLNKNISTCDLPLYYIFIILIFILPVSALVLLIPSLIMSVIRIKDKLYFLVPSAIILNIITLIIYRKKLILTGVQNQTLIIFLIVLLCSMTAIEITMMIKDKMLSQIFIALIFTNMLSVFVFMLKNQPYEYLYYNQLHPKLNQGEYIYKYDYLDTHFTAVQRWITNDQKIKNKQNVKIYLCSNPDKYEQYLKKNNQEITYHPVEADYIICPYNVFDIAPSYTLEKNGILLTRITKIY